MPYYLNKNIDGLIEAHASNDGYTIQLKIARAFPTVTGNSIGYNVYMQAGAGEAFEEVFFRTAPAYIYIGTSNIINIVDLQPGTMYQFGVRAFEYNPNNINYNSFQNIAGLIVLPRSLLSENISATDTIIPLLDASEFPNTANAICKIGYELISYSSVNYDNNTLILNSIDQRGLNETFAASHTTDGYYVDGYGSGFIDPTLIYYPIVVEESNTRISEAWCRFDVGHYAYTQVDGYHQITKDILTTDLTYSDTVNTGFQAYTFTGWHRTDPVLLLNGTCVGSYMNNNQFCADSNTGVGMQLRGFNIQDANMQRQEVLLSTTSEPVCLIKRSWTGITCKCYLPDNENPGFRCPKCNGTGFITGYSQFFNPRESDSRIPVRFDPSVDDLLATDSGLESDMKPNCWTLPVPTIKDRDFIVRFDENDEEEFRYEVLNVTRNKLFLDQTGAQKFAVQRVRKTDPIYQVPVFRNTSLYPQTYQTGITGSTSILPHQHSYVLNEKPSYGARQLSGINAGHNHPLYIDPETGVLTIGSVLGHTHTLF